MQKDTEMEEKPPTPGPVAPASRKEAGPATSTGSGGSAKSWVVGIVICALMILSVVVIVRRSRAAAAAAAKLSGGPPAVPVTLITAKAGDVGVYVSGIGTVTPVATVEVRSRVDGQLIQVNYAEGQLVNVGDSLVEIDSGPYQAALTQAEGEYARDTALLTNALIDLKRYQEAYTRNAIPEQQLATQQATVDQYRGTVKLDQGQIDNAKVNLAYCHITAPISGRVGLRLVDAGNIVHATDTNPLVVITQLKPITVVFTVAEDYLPDIQHQIALGQKLTVDAYDRAREQKIATGTVLTLDNQISTSTGTVAIKAIFDNDEETLFPNQFVNARLLVRTDTNVTIVPISAIQRNAQGPFVYVVKTDQTVTMRPVQQGDADANAGVSAVSGLEPGEVIAGDNFNRLQEGAKTVPRKAQQGKKPAGSAAGKPDGAKPSSVGDSKLQGGA
jgi:multidrug efflux system membrane fusion protein